MSTVKTKPRYGWKLYEWDADFGDMLRRRYYSSRREARKALEELIKDAKAEGWECQWLVPDKALCGKCDEEGCYNREVGIERTYLS